MKGVSCTLHKLLHLTDEHMRFNNLFNLWNSVLLPSSVEDAIVKHQSYATCTLTTGQGGSGVRGTVQEGLTRRLVDLDGDTGGGAAGEGRVGSQHYCWLHPLHHHHHTSTLPSPHLHHSPTLPSPLTPQHRYTPTLLVLPQSGQICHYQHIQGNAGVILLTHLLKYCRLLLVCYKLGRGFGGFAICLLIRKLKELVFMYRGLSTWCSHAQLLSQTTLSVSFKQ